MERPVEAVLFDIGDTLINSTAIARAALTDAAGVLAREGIVPDRAAFEATYLREDAKIQGPAINHLFSGPEIVQAAFEAAGLPAHAGVSGSFLMGYQAGVRRRIRRNQELVSLLEELRTRAGTRLGVITDGSTVFQLEQCYRLGILDQLEVFVTSEAVGVEKPDGRIFRKALDDLGLPAEAVVFVGNSMERDILGARNAGLCPVLVAPGDAASDSECVTIRSVFHLPEILRAALPCR